MNPEIEKNLIHIFEILYARKDSYHICRTNEEDLLINFDQINERLKNKNKKKKQNS